MRSPSRLLTVLTTLVLSIVPVAARSGGIADAADASFVSLVPGRLMDTRPGESTVDGLGAGGGLRAAGSVTELVVAGRGAVGNVVASDASAAVLNVTVTGATGDGYATVWPCAAGGGG